MPPKLKTPKLTTPKLKPPRLTMPKPSAPDWKRALETGMHFTELRRSQARAIVNDLVAQGHVARDQMTTAVDDVVELSRKRSDDLRKVVQHEVQRQLSALGLATKTDLAALERRMTRASREAKKAATKKAAAKKAPKKTAAAKTSRKAG